MLFKTKVKQSGLEGPLTILTELTWVTLKSEKVQDIVESTLRTSAWNSHNGKDLQTMISRDKEDERYSDSYKEGD